MKPLIKKIAETFKAINIDKGSILLLEIPPEGYFKTNLATISELVKNGFRGVYVSFHRPAINVRNFMLKQGIDIGGISFVDVATLLAREEAMAKMRHVHVPQSVVINDLTRSVLSALNNFKKKRFVFVDSITSPTLYVPEYTETIREFCHFLTQLKHDNALVVINMAKSSERKEFVKDLEMYAAKVIE